MVPAPASMLTSMRMAPPPPLVGFAQQLAAPPLPGA